MSLWTLLVMLGGGCSLAFDTGQTQCASDADCAERGLGGTCVDEVCTEVASPATVGTGASGAATATTTTTSASSGGGAGGGGAGGDDTDNWRCLGEVDWPVPDTETFVTLKSTFRGVGGAPPPADLIYSFCATLDPTCEQPLVDETPMPEDGEVAIEVRAGTIGYFEITGPTLRPTMLFINRPADVDSGSNAAVTLVTEAIYEAIVTQADFTTDETRGTLLTITTDCDENPAPGARIESQDADAEATRFYFIGLVPGPNESVTDTGGLGGIFNFPAGDGLVESFVDADDRSIGKATFRIRPGWLSNVSIEPTPVD